MNVMSLPVKQELEISIKDKITKQNVSQIIKLDKYEEPHMSKDQMYISVPCVYCCVNFVLYDSTYLGRLADKVRAEESGIEDLKPVYFTEDDPEEIGEYDSDTYYNFNVDIVSGHEGNWCNHLGKIAFEVRNSEREDDERTYFIELSDSEEQVVYDYINKKAKELFNKSGDELLLECEKEVQW